MNDDLSALEWSIRVGGTGDDIGTSLAITADRIYITGHATSDFFAPSDIYAQESVLGGNLSNNEATGRFLGQVQDAFVVAVPKSLFAADTTESSPLDIRFLGGINHDRGYFLDLDETGNVYVAGQTHGDYPVHNTEDRFHQHARGHFLHKLSPDLSPNTDHWAITFGGLENQPQITPVAFQVDHCGRIYLTGWGGGNNNYSFLYVNRGRSHFNLPVDFSRNRDIDMRALPVTPDAFRYSTTDGNEFYSIVLAADAKEILYGGYFGGAHLEDHTDGGTSRYDKDGVVYQTTCACFGFRAGSPPVDDFPTTDSAFVRLGPTGEACNMTGVKLYFKTGRSSFFAVNTLAGDRPDVERVCAPETLVFTSPDEVLPVDVWEVEVGGTVVHTVSGANPLRFDFSESGTYTVRLTKQDQICARAYTFSRTIEVLPRPSYKLEGDSVLCGTGSMTSLRVERMEASPLPSTYAWEPVTHVAGSATQAEMTSVSLPLGETAYQVTITEDLCVTTEEFVVKVLPVPTVSIVKTEQPLRTCAGDGRVVLEGTAAHVSSFYWDMGDGTPLTKYQGENTVKHEFPRSGIYTVSLTGVVQEAGVQDALCSALFRRIFRYLVQNSQILSRQTMMA